MPTDKELQYLSNIQVHQLKICESTESNVPNDAVLCSVEGPFISVDEINNNMRGYTFSLVENKIRNYPTTIELMENRTLFGELSHPEERFDIDLNKVSHNVIKLWWDEAKKVLWGRADILNTPAGRMVYTMIKYGSKMGISARARGSMTVRDGISYPDEDNYVFKGFDFVPNPGFSTSRLSPVNESSNATFIDTLNKYLDEATSSDIKSLKPIFESMDSNIYDSIKSKIDAKIKNSTSDKEILDESYENLFEENIITESKLLESEEEISTLRAKISTLTENIQTLNNQVSSYRKDIKDLKESIDSQASHFNKEISKSKLALVEKSKEVDVAIASNVKLEESIDSLSKEIDFLQESNSMLKATYFSKIEESTETKKLLNKQIKNLKTQLSKKEEKIVESVKPVISKPKIKKSVKKKSNFDYGAKAYYQTTVVNESIVSKPQKVETINSINENHTRLNSFLTQIN